MSDTFPVACFCGKRINQLWVKYRNLIGDGKNECEALDSLKVSKMCCRRMFISHVDLSDKLRAYALPARRIEKDGVITID